MFGGNLSSLRSLELRTCWLDMPKYNIGENLTSLSTVLDGMHEDRFQGVPTTMEAWLPILKGLPNLAKLSIEQHYPSTGSISPTLPVMDVSLDRLEYLKLKIRLSHLDVFLKHVTIPTSARICLKLYNVRSDTQFRPSLVRLIRRHAAPSSDAGNALSIRACDEQGIHVGFATDADAKSLTKPRRDKICLHLRVRTNRTSPIDMAPYLSPMLWAWLPVIKHTTILHVVPASFSFACVQVIEEVMTVMPELQSLICPLSLLEALPSIDFVNGKHQYRSQHASRFAGMYLLQELKLLQILSNTP
ncbi:hypothetical protein FA13DRAFT_1789860 [Coprinellus micaceus]|uniref:F-box domain-containing protein n=1 Tax=Coprinellus micaceus TaxID=71717 RepID=A0A4Y7TGV6_COPMI|nr:hypothetical protein FA13DRAFT_1789860 [Coprinellus micaceus]